VSHELKLWVRQKNAVLFRNSNGFRASLTNLFYELWVDFDESLWWITSATSWTRLTITSDRSDSRSVSRPAWPVCVVCSCAPCRLRGCKNRPAPFPGWMS